MVDAGAFLCAERIEKACHYCPLFSKDDQATCALRVAACQLKCSCLIFCILTGQAPVMLFNSFEFLIFLPIVFWLYWFVFNKNVRVQNILILLASYVFYGWWDYRFLGLILLSTLVDYYSGIAIANASSRRAQKGFLIFSMAVNLGLLGFFKYYNFFVQSWVDLFQALGYPIKSVWTLQLILPVGISFYTFQTMSYTIDVFKGKIKATRDFISFAAFVSFFPQLVAGPIERASNLLPQIQKSREFTYRQGIDALRLILWGLFKKVVIADTLAPDVDYIFSNYASLNSSTLLLGAVYFAIQIYGDFSGYSDIAIGVAKLFGIELMSNFRFPYFSRNISEFWRRWHISLSTWFRDYLYIPLGGSRVSRERAIRNIFAIFVISGFWHGANWTFVAWGAIHASLYLPLFLLNKNRKYPHAEGPESIARLSWHNLWRMALTFSMVTLAWVFFRSANLVSAVSYLKTLAGNFAGPPEFTSGLPYIFVLFILEWHMRGNERSIVFSKKRVIRYALYVLMSFMIYDRLFSSEIQFIYFQF